MLVKGAPGPHFYIKIVFPGDKIRYQISLGYFNSIQFKNVYCHTNTVECIQYIYAHKEYNTYMPIRKVNFWTRKFGDFLDLISFLK